MDKSKKVSELTVEELEEIIRQSCRYVVNVPISDMPKFEGFYIKAEGDKQNAKGI